MKDFRFVPALVCLLERGAARNYVRITGAELGAAISRSQQAASDHLRELERAGLVERVAGARHVSVRVTSEGRELVSGFAGAARSALDVPSGPLLLRGTLESGSGEGRYYMALRGYAAQFRKKIGYVPFPGTLNVRLGSEADVASVSRLDPGGGVLIDGFADGVRTYGWVRCHACTLNGRVQCMLIRLERTHHSPSIVELVSESELRGALGLRDGSSVTISVAS